MLNLPTCPSPLRLAPPWKASRFAAYLQYSKAAQALEILLVFSPLFLALIFLRFFPNSNPPLSMAVIWLANVVMLVLIGWSQQLPVKGRTPLGFSLGRPSWRGAVVLILQSFVIFFLAVTAFVFGGTLMVDVHADADLSRFNYLQGDWIMLIVSLIGVFIVASIGEEVVYRGFLLNRLEVLWGAGTKYAVPFAVIISALIFGLVHFDWGMTGVVQTTCMGLVLALSYIVLKRRLWPLIIAHAYMDTILLVQLYLAP